MKVLGSGFRADGLSPEYGTLSPEARRSPQPSALKPEPSTLEREPSALKPSALEPAPTRGRTLSPHARTLSPHARTLSLSPQATQKPSTLRPCRTATYIQLPVIVATASAGAAEGVGVLGRRHGGVRCRSGGVTSAPAYQQ